jgi:hypothetical protein
MSGEPYYIHSRNGSVIYKKIHTDEIIVSNKYDMKFMKNTGYTIVGAINKLKIILTDVPLIDSIVQLIQTHKIKYIELHPNFNYSIDKLPDCVECIDIKSHRYNVPITKLPNNLKIFKLAATNYQHNIACWPLLIRKIYLCGKCDKLVQFLPAYLETLDLYDLDPSTELWYIPPSLNELYFKSSCGSPSVAAQIIKYQLPPNLKILFIENLMDGPIDQECIEFIDQTIELYIACTKKRGIIDFATSQVVRYTQEDMFIKL